MIDGLLDFFGAELSEVIGGGVLWLIDILLSFLPMSPFLGLDVSWMPDGALGWLNWFVGVDQMITLMGAWLACVLLYMVLKKVLEAVGSIDGIKNTIGSFLLGLGKG